MSPVEMDGEALARVLEAGESALSKVLSEKYGFLGPSEKEPLVPLCSGTRNQDLPQVL